MNRTPGSSTVGDPRHADGHFSDTGSVAERALEFLPDGVLHLDRAGRVLYMNSAAERMVQVERRKAVGRHLAESVPHLLETRFHRECRRVLDMQTSAQFADYCSQFGTWFHVRAYPASEGLSAFVRQSQGPGRDAESFPAISAITEMLLGRFDLENALSAAVRAPLVNLADLSVIHLVHPSGRVAQVAVAHADPAVEQIARDIERGWARQRVQPPHLAEVIASGEGSLLSWVEDALLERIAGDAHQLAALKALDPKATVCVPLPGHARIIGVLTLVSTSPDRPFGKAELEIGRELGRRAGPVLDAALRYRAARVSARSRRNVLSMAAHDLRSPLNTISMGVQVLRNALSDAERVEVRRPLQAIDRSAQQMDRLIQDLADLSRIQARRLMVRRRWISVRRVLGDAVAMSRFIAAGRNVRLETRVPRGLPRILADRTRLLQVLTNLLSNAIKFTPDGGLVLLSVAVEPDTLRFTIADSGPGIPKEQLRWIFSAYRHPDRDAGGTGLGLAIARGIVLAHDGKITVESEPGEGTIVSFTLPLDGEPAPTDQTR